MTDGDAYRVRSRTERFAGAVFTVVTDEVELPDRVVVTRDYLRHTGAVAVVPLDEADRVWLVRQYRHPVGRLLWELPAGLVDVAGESLPELAARELAEETDLVAGRLDPLLDLHPSPGCSDERVRIFLARDLSPVAEPHRREHEEATMTVTRFPLDDAIGMIFDGRITNGITVAGLLATAHARGTARTSPPASGLAPGTRPGDVLE